MVTRMQNNTKTPKVGLATQYPLPTYLMANLATASVEPTCFTQASKDFKWRQVIDTEMNTLLKNKTWSLVPYHRTMNLIGCKWVFKLKHKPDGSIDRYKARLMAKSFHQLW